MRSGANYGQALSLVKVSRISFLSLTHAILIVYQMPIFTTFKHCDLAPRTKHRHNWNDNDDRVWTAHADVAELAVDADLKAASWEAQVEASYEA